MGQVKLSGHQSPSRLGGQRIETMRPNENLTTTGSVFAPAEPMMAVYHDGQDVQVTPVVGFAASFFETSTSVRIDGIVQDPAGLGTFVELDHLKSYAGCGGGVPASA